MRGSSGGLWRGVTRDDDDDDDNVSHLKTINALDKIGRVVSEGYRGPKVGLGTGCNFK